ncbi:protoporphyrinogen oxidase [Asanoa sp. WMMD1127]|uniref:protoporphyrinogen oxidase n=1 Tax=Asanoa sp. WMMD1127 TaxID=3016107 RepID=UPI002415C985|nr:protoporphyrinogen oxidase [Asanoa sp. WMMD1127]MDG4823810.1 protoporphyrinogen oxidase [Asanoa sp. WMMD1127]
MRSVAVIGGGIAGLAAAVRIRDQAPDVRVTVFEQGATLGGKLRTGELAGSPVELGAEAFLVRDAATGADSPAITLARRVGLGADLVNPAVGAAALAVDGKLVPMPRGTLTGVPGDLAALEGVARVADHDLDAGRPLLAEGADVAVGALVRRRLGDQVVDRLVDPMLGGVYAGRADQLSLAATMPALAQQARVEGTLTGAVKAAQAAFPRVPGGAVFATVRGGVSRLVEAAAAASGAEIRLGATVRELARTPEGWRLTVGPTRDPQHVTVDAVVLAVPARPAARLLAAVEHVAAERVGALDYASVALVTLALPRPELPELSGFLVPAENGTAVKAATFFSTKWAHLARPDGVALVRASVGRYGDEHVLQRDDAELAAIVHRELSNLVEHSLPKPLETKVQRWGGALPQYAPGHLDRVAAARAALRASAPTVALAGAGYDGVGIPICVRSGEAAADAVLAALRDPQRRG